MKPIKKQVKKTEKRIKKLIKQFETLKQQINLFDTKNKTQKENDMSKQPNFENILFTMANHIIQKDPTITNLKLQKLLYYIHAHYLVNNKKDLNKDLYPECSIHAWLYGPVFPNLYFKLSHHGDQPLKTIDENDFTPVKLTKAQITSIKYVLNKYGKMEPFQLAKKTHLEDPWLKKFNDDGNDLSQNIISEKAIFEYYKNNPLKL